MKPCPFCGEAMVILVNERGMRSACLDVFGGLAWCPLNAVAPNPVVRLTFEPPVSYGRMEGDCPAIEHEFPIGWT